MAKEPNDKTKSAPRSDAPDPLSSAVPLELNPVAPNEPYPTGDPKTAQTYAEINGLVPVGTGPLAPAPPPPPEEDAPLSRRK